MAPLEEYRNKIKSEKRAAILEAALEAFLEHGYECTSLQRIAKMAGISTGTLFNHFKSKSMLFGEIMEHFWEGEPGQNKPKLPKGQPEQALLETGRNYARLLSGQHTLALFRVIIAEAPRFPELGQSLFERGKAPYLNRLHGYLSEEVQAGTLTIEDIPLSARQFLGMINDVIFWPRMMLTNYKISDDEIERAIQEAALTFMARYGKIGSSKK
jgi:AcrR family transcriptional regulator